MSRRQQGRRYAEAERQEALDLAGRVGFAEAARVLELPAPTLRSWAHRRSAAALAVVGGSAALTPAEVALPWPERRARLLPKLGQVAAEALDAAQRAIADGKARDAQSFLVGAAVAIDKAQLIGGGATTRSESTSVRIDATNQREVAEQVAAMRRELGYPSDVVDAEVVDGDA